jgi:hypothetical protein
VGAISWPSLRLVPERQLHLHSLLCCISMRESHSTERSCLIADRLAFSQPLLNPGDGPIVLILAPTRELAVQIQTECTKFGYVRHDLTAAVIDPGLVPIRVFVTPPSTVAHQKGHKSVIFNEVSRLSSPHRAVSSTCWRLTRPTSEGSPTSLWTRPTACWTWVSNLRFAKLSARSDLIVKP